MEEQPKYGVVVGVTEQPAPSGVVVGVLTEQPGASSGGAARGGLDAEKWVGRPPPLAPEDLYTGPRRDGLLSTEELSGDYRCCCFPFVCQSMTVVPLGPDAIETWNTCCLFLAEPGVRPRNPGTNAFLNPQHPDPNSDLMTFSADGTAKQGGCGYKKRQTSQKRTFQKVDARDLAGKWLGCVCIPISLAWPFSPVFCITKKALNEDQYEESGCCCVLGLPPCPHRKLRTRNYVNGHPTNGFASDGGKMEILWYRDPGCAAGPLFFAKKVG